MCVTAGCMQQAWWYVNGSNSKLGCCRLAAGGVSSPLFFVERTLLYGVALAVMQQLQYPALWVLMVSSPWGLTQRGGTGWSGWVTTRRCLVVSRFQHVSLVVCDSQRCRIATKDGKALPLIGGNHHELLQELAYVITTKQMTVGCAMACKLAAAMSADQLGDAVVSTLSCYLGKPSCCR